MAFQELNDSELSRHIDSFKFPLEAGKEECLLQLQHSFTHSRKLLDQRQQDVLRLRNSSEDLFSKLQALASYEKTLRAQANTETTKAAEGQIFFQGDDYKAFNSVPFLVTLLVFCKIWIYPVLGLMTPILLFISPYIILQTMFNLTITWDVYVTMMKQLVFGISGNDPWTLKHGIQALWTFIGLGQGIIQPFITSYHTSTIDKAIIERGEALLQIYSTMKEIHETFRTLGVLQSCPLEVPEIPSDVHEAVAWMNAEPLGMKCIWKLLGRMTILITLANDSSWTPVEWSGPLVLEDMSDLAIPSKRAITSNLDLQGHALLTGPNRGGKSSSLRAILQQVLLGQTFGFTRFATGSWTPFYKVLTRLKSYDTAGKESLFEMEVRNASRMIRTLYRSPSPSLVLIDELFHSTNPPDAEVSAKVFLEQLWKLQNTYSIISTHIFSLCENPPDGLATLCCPAEESDGCIQYSYTLREGICRVSSVREVLKESGLARI